ncbi:hypothetical protein [Empedobacter falsenii]|uniref:Phage abortive infection protein n=1 Tax=Empedobacter falsenii TaxID=343874 RepID=A0AAW7DHN4_9FLAO|nr:hypothetical protein [Empedobacter falsenii]MDM1550642.1 hypothetical protein [Empedobacter falsenii]
MAKPFTKTQLIIAFIVLIILSAIPLIIYTSFFFSHSKSEDPANWGTFGDFIGGTTNVILGIINIIITAYIAYLIKTLDDKRYEDQKKIDELRHQQNIDLQKDIFINNLKFKEYESFQKLVKKLIITVRNESNLKNIEIELYNLQQSYRIFSNSKRELFPFLEDYQDVSRKFEDLINYCNELKPRNINDINTFLITTSYYFDLIEILESIDFNFILHFEIETFKNFKKIEQKTSE